MHQSIPQCIEGVFTEVVGLVCVFPGNKKRNASDSALMAAPEPEGAAGTSGPTDTTVQKCGS